MKLISWSISRNCLNEGLRTLAPHCRSPRSWRWPCKTTCPSDVRSHWTDVSGLVCWCLGSPHCPEKKPPWCWGCTAGRSPWLPEGIPPWCRFFQSRSVRTQICRRGSHRCRTSPGAQSPETPDATKTICLTWCYDVLHAGSVPPTSSCAAWGWKTLSISKTRVFPLFSTLSEDSLLGSVVTTTDRPSSCCWSSFNTGFTRHSTRMLPANTEAGWWPFTSGDEVSLPTFELHQLLVVLPAQGNLLPVFLKEIFVGFGHLDDGCWYLPSKRGHRGSDFCLTRETESWLKSALRTCFFASLMAAP